MRDICDRLDDITAFVRFETSSRVHASASISEEAKHTIQVLRLALQHADEGINYLSLYSMIEPDEATTPTSEAGE